MWEEAIKVAVVGFSVVIGGLVMLTIGVKLMSVGCASDPKGEEKIVMARSMRSRPEQRLSVCRLQSRSVRASGLELSLRYLHYSCMTML